MLLRIRATQLGVGFTKIHNDGTTKLMETGFRCTECKCSLATLFRCLSQNILVGIVGFLTLLSNQQSSCMIVQSFHNSFHCSLKKALGIIIIIIIA